MRVAYADPPYLGMGKKMYGKYHEEAYIWDEPQSHADLMKSLDADFDGWALSLHEPSLRILLPLAPEGVRVGAWVKPFAVYRRGVDPAYTWEPVIYRTARTWDQRQNTVRDHISCNIAMMKGHPGAKPEGFCFWLFDLLGLTPQDDFVDMFEGSGSVREAHKKWCETFPQKTSVLANTNA